MSPYVLLCVEFLIFDLSSLAISQNLALACVEFSILKALLIKVFSYPASGDRLATFTPGGNESQ
jgi:hypothetical protein